MKYSCVKSIALPQQLLRAPVRGSNILSGVSIIALLVLLSGCAVDTRTHRDADVASEWDIASVPTDAANFVVDELDDFNTTPVDVSTRVSVSTDTGVDSELPSQVAAIEPPEVKKKVTRSRSKAKPRKRNRMPEIAQSACAAPFHGQDETVTLATTSDLKLRQGPSTSAATISVFSEGTMLTARKLSCGNWTEIVDGERTIGYMHSYFLTSP